ncbi:MAG: hypothetical protein MI923_07250 [Phycisphaerales bacterium]|nr:hypothetical protein [Phycisphaerales bacterium]
MTTDTDQQLATLRDKSQSRARLEQRYSETRDALNEAQSKMRGVELYLEQAQAELKQLEGFSFTGMVYGLLGQKGDRLAKAQQVCAELEQQHEECAQALSALEEEVSGLSRELEQAGQADAQYQELLAEKQKQLETVGDERGARLAELKKDWSATQDAIKAIKRAMEACEEALSDLHGEMEVVSTLGRCQVAAPRGALRVVLNASRHHTAGDCAGRVRQSIGRFRRKLSDVVSKYGPDAEKNLLKLDDDLDRISNEFSASWLKDAYTHEQSAEFVDQLLQGANMLLEKKLMEMKQEADSLEGQRQAVIEKA